MFIGLTYFLYAFCAVLTVWALYMCIRKRPANPPLLITAATLELVLIVQGIVGLALWGGSGPDTDAVLFFGYLLTALVLVPLAVFWAYAELSLWGPLVLAAAGVTVFVMIERMDQIWV